MTLFEAAHCALFTGCCLLKRRRGNGSRCLPALCAQRGRVCMSNKGSVCDSQSEMSTLLLSDQSHYAGMSAFVGNEKFD